MKLQPSLPGGVTAAPIFIPEATYGAVRGVGGDELAHAGVRIVMGNAFHLMRKPGITRVNALGGLKAMMGWSGLLMTDSGGYQAYSLIRKGSKFGHISRDGLTFRPEGGDRDIKLTAERAIINQLRLGADILFCLDDCTHADDPLEQQQLSVERTMRWAADCKKAFRSALGRRADDPDRPRLYGVVQGGRDETLRRRCAEALLEIGFDGYGFGGWPLDGERKLLADVFALVRDLVPCKFPLHALGIGHPASIVQCARMGYQLFDSSLPTRDARRGRLYRFTQAMPSLEGEDWFDYVYIQDEIHARSKAPVSEDCPCVSCRSYSRGYLNHLADREEPLFWRLATLHNLTFMRQLTDLLAKEAQA